MCRKLFLITSLTICSVAALHTQSQIKAQTTDDSCNFINTIDSQFNSERDGATYQPSNLEQCDNPDPRDRAIVGNDDRIPVTSQQAPWASIGRLYSVINDEVYVCTGTLVGRDLVLTNSHCIFHEDGQNNIYSASQIVFRPNLVQGRSVRTDTATVISVTAGWEEDYGNISEDWALLRIDKPLGEKYGYLGWRELDFSDSETV
jgi:protease YdgD